MRSVLDRSDREDVRLHQPRCANASAFGLRGYVDTLSPLVAMHLLDRSYVIVGNFLKLHAKFPNTLGIPKLRVFPLLILLISTSHSKLENFNHHKT